MHRVIFYNTRAAKNISQFYFWMKFHLSERYGSCKSNQYYDEYYYQYYSYAKPRRKDFIEYIVLLLSIGLTCTQSVSVDNGMDSNILSGYLNKVGVCNIILILIQEPEKSNILQPFYLMLEKYGNLFIQNK